MTADQRASIKVIGSLLLAISAPILVALVVGAWSSKESVRDHQADINAIQTSVQRILDVVCEGKTSTARACK